MEGYTRTAVERAMKVHEVILQARARKITWLQAAEVLGIHPRTMRRWKRKMDQHGVHSLIDQRSRIPSPRRVPGAEIDHILELYRERYAGFNVRHFHDVVTRDHDVRRSYTLVKRVLQGAGLVRRQRTRGKHRRRRERQPCFGELLHLDGSRHRWLTGEPDSWQTLITVVDDATGRLLYAQLWPRESRLSVMTALRAVFQEHGLPQRLYTDRASWAAHTPRAGGPADPRARTQVQRALEELGIDHVRAYSPQARGRSERVNRTLQGRVVNELRARGLFTVEPANRFLADYRIEFDQRFACPPADPAPGFVPLGRVDLDQYLCVKVARRVGRDNTVVCGRRVLQIPQQPRRRSCQGMRVAVRQHLDGSFSVHAGPRRLAVYDPSGRIQQPDLPVMRSRDRRSGAILRSRFRQAARRATRGQKRTDHLSKSSGQITCY